MADQETTLDARLAMSLAIRDYINQMHETMTRIERMVSAFKGLAAGDAITLGAVLSVSEVAELQALANLAQFFLADAREAAPTFLPATKLPAPKLP